MKANGPADSISHSFRGILEARDTGLFRLAGERTHSGGFSDGAGGEGKDRGHTSSVSGKNARGTVCPASHFRSAMSSFDFRRESTRRLSFFGKDLVRLPLYLVGDALAICTSASRGSNQIADATVTMNYACDGGEVNKKSLIANRVIGEN